MTKKKRQIVLPQLPATATVIDTHCHLDMIGSGDDIGLTIKDAASHGVAPLITVGIDLASSKKAVDLAGRFDSVYATVGVHPHNVQSLQKSTYAELEKLGRSPKVVAYGEIGLDYVKQYAPRDIQLEHYAHQLDLARQVGLPVVIHDREAHGDILRFIKTASPFPAGGVMHCFSGDWQLARQVLALDFVISLPGVVTFSNASAMQEVAQKIPLDRLILETDAPFLAPHPMRGKQNIPTYILYTAQKIAELRGIALEELASATSENARQIFNLPPN